MCHPCTTNHNRDIIKSACQLLSHRIEPCMPIFTLVYVTCCFKFLMNVRSINATNVPQWIVGKSVFNLTHNLHMVSVYSNCGG